MSNPIQKKRVEIDFDLDDVLLEKSTQKQVQDYFESASNTSYQDDRSKSQQNSQMRETSRRGSYSSFNMHESSSRNYKDNSFEFFRGRQDIQKDQCLQNSNKSLKNQLSQQRVFHTSFTSKSDTFTSINIKSDVSDLNIFQRLQLQDKNMFSHKKYESNNKLLSNQEISQFDKQKIDTSIFNGINDYKQLSSESSSLNSNFNNQNIFLLQDMSKQVELNKINYQDQSFQTSKKDHVSFDYSSKNSNQITNHLYEDDQDEQDSFNLLDLPIFENEQNVIQNQTDDKKQCDLKMISDSQDIFNYETNEDNIDTQNQNQNNLNIKNYIEYSDIKIDCLNQDQINNQVDLNIKENKEQEDSYNNKENQENKNGRDNKNESNYKDNRKDKDDNDDEDDDEDIDFLKNIANNCVIYQKQNQINEKDKVKIEDCQEKIINDKDKSQKDFQQMNKKIETCNYKNHNVNMNDEQTILNNVFILEDLQSKIEKELLQNKQQNELNNSFICTNKQSKEEQQTNNNRQIKYNINNGYQGQLFSNKIEYNDESNAQDNPQINDQNIDNSQSTDILQKQKNFNIMEIEEDQIQQQNKNNKQNKSYLNEIQNKSKQIKKNKQFCLNNQKNTKKNEVKQKQISKQVLEQDIQRFDKDNVNIKQDSKINLIDEEAYNNTLNQQQQNNEAQKSPSSILQQVSSIFQTMIDTSCMLKIPQFSNQTILSNQREMKTPESIKDQINQIQNQVNSIQNTIMHIPLLLQEVTSLLNRVTSTDGDLQQDSQSPLYEQFSLQQSKNKQQNNIQEQPINQKEDIHLKNQLKYNNQVLYDDLKIQNDQDFSCGEEIEQENNENNQGSQNDNISELDALKYKQQNKQRACLIEINNQINSKRNSQRIDSNMNQIVPNIKHKNKNTAKQILTPIKQTKPNFISSINNSLKVSQKNKCIMNSENRNPRELNLCIIDDNTIQKTEDIKVEESDLTNLYDYLNKLDEPSCFLIVKEKFPNLSDEQINKTVDEFKQQNKIGVIQLFLPRCASSTYARINYYADINTPVHKPKQPQTIEAEKENIFENKEEVIVKNNVDRKKFEQMTGEQLINYQNELNQRKQALLDKKQNTNPSFNKIQRIQQWNDMKEVCSFVFERISVIKGKHIQEVYDDFGLKNFE